MSFSQILISSKIYIVLIVAILSVNLALSRTLRSDGKGNVSDSLGKDTDQGKLSRAKRSPFIIAFQVTRPPGLFQLSMRKPVIMNVMSNMTSMILGSEIARMLSKGFTGQPLLVPLNVSTASPTSTKKKT